MIEEFRDIPNYEGIYQVSNLGRVKSLKCNKERILKNGHNGKGYLHIMLSKDCIKKIRTIHQLVAEAFLGHVPCGHKLVVNHINFNRQDNRPQNLEIVTQRENSNKKHLSSSSKYIGVSWFKRDSKWKAYINLNGKRKNLGSFTCELKAAKAYQDALKAL
tara:strand:- start:134 stop:613 length:480 start_codon:yes stop_codon:yes gene_type:complete